MTANTAWQRHGCYKLGSDQYFNMPLQKALTGCEDDWNSLDHFDPTTPSRRMFAQFNYLRSVYGALQDGFNLVQRGNWTHFETLPGSNQTATELGLWTVSRSGIPGVQTLSGNHTDQVWLLYTNENATKTYNFDCDSPSWISSPYVSGTIIQNLFAPYEVYTLEDSLSSFNNDSKAPWQGCLPNVTMDPYGFKMLVPQTEWVPALPALTKFSPGHDARILAEATDTNATTVEISLEFNMAMDCTSISNSLSFNVSSSGNGTAPTFDASAVKCNTLTNSPPSHVQGAASSAFQWNATLTGVPDGILTITLNNPAAASGATTGVRVYFALRRRSTDVIF